MYLLLNECNHQFQTNDFYVYGYFSDEKPFYIGKGRDRRYNAHIIKRNSLLASRGANKHLLHTIIKLVDSQQLITIKLLFTGDEQNCFSKEIELIQQHGRKIDNSGILLNILNGGEGYTQDGKPVSQFNMFGEWIADYKNAKEAARLNGWSSYSVICGCCKHRRNNTTFRGFYWAYKGEVPALLTKNKIVYQFTKEGIFVQKYQNASKAAQFLRKNICSEICKCCRGKAKTAGGYRWSYSLVL